MPLFHGSRSKFDRFRIPEGEADLSGATNGFLGVWFVRDSHKWVAEGYAGEDGFIAQIDEPDKTLIHKISVKDLANMHSCDHGETDDAVFYGNVRRSILDSGKSWIEIIEQDGSAPQMICLAPETISDIRWYDRICTHEEDISP